MSWFTCANCKKAVNLVAPGTKNRNHCNFCLHSVHVDMTPGDRASVCGGIMKPIGKVYKQDGEEMVVHECVQCGFKRKNRVAGDDDFEILAKLPELDATMFLA